MTYRPLPPDRAAWLEEKYTSDRVFGYAFELVTTSDGRFLDLDWDRSP